MVLLVLGDAKLALTVKSLRKTLLLMVAVLPPGKLTEAEFPIALVPC